MKLISVKIINQALLSMFLVSLAIPALAVNNYTITPGSQISDAGVVVGTPGNCVAASGWLTVPNAGACIHVQPGTYSGTVTTTKSGTGSARIVFISDTKWGAKTVNGSWQVLTSYVDVDGFDITNPSDRGYAFNLTGVTGNRIQYNNMHDFTVNACGAAPVNTRSTVDVLINGNIIRHSGHYPDPDPVCSHGIYEEGLRTVISNNIISGIAGWGIKSNVAAPNQCGPRVIVNNTIFNNGGGIDLTEQNDSGFVCNYDYSTISNNIVVMNGVNVQGHSHFGINFYHVSGTHNLVTNNLVYGNLPADYAHHDVACAPGTPISGSDANGTAGGCPSTNPKTDPSTSVTFTNFQSDTWLAPASNYNAENYQLRPGSSGVGSGSMNCTPSGPNPCVPAADFVGVARLSSGSGVDIGAFELSSGSEVATAPAAPTGLTATVQ